MNNKMQLTSDQRREHDNILRMKASMREEWLHRNRDAPAAIERTILWHRNIADSGGDNPEYHMRRAVFLNELFRKNH